MSWLACFPFSTPSKAMKHEEHEEHEGKASKGCAGRTASNVLDHVQLFFVSFVFFVFPAFSQAPQKIDASKSQIRFVSKQMGVPVEGRFRKFDATVAFDPKKPEA